MSRALDVAGRVTFQREIGPGLFHLAVEVPGIARLAEPGQFVQVRVATGIEPLLRRPMSLSGVRGGRIEMLYEVVGKGTRALSQRKTGETLQVLGPLGMGFKFPARSAYPVLIGGGIGVPPLLFLASRMKTKGTAFLGARTKGLLLGEKSLSRLGWVVKISTDDGTRGHKGFVSEIFGASLDDLSSGAVVYACGPLPMLRAVAEICEHTGLTCQVSLEAMMACGIGVCRGCVVPVRGERNYMDICREGPVVDARHVRWDDECWNG